MNSLKEIFKYQKSRKIGEIITIASIITLMIFIMDAEGSEIAKIILTILFTGFLIFMVSYTYLLNENIELNNESLKVNKKIGKSTKIKYDEIRKVTIREEYNSVEVNHFAMTIFGKYGNNRIIISDLDNQFRMISLFEEKGKEYNFNIIHQNVKGEIIKTLKRRQVGYKR